jgi:formylglycine-generating enzyme required for sulfatase activity
MKSLPAALVVVFLSGTVLATDLDISKPVFYLEGDKAYAVFNLSWDNSWHNERNNDAVWLFAKLVWPTGGAKHIKVLNSEHQALNLNKSNGIEIKFESSENRVGIFVYPGEEHHGNVHITVRLALDPVEFEGVNTRNSALQIYGIEMVRIPEGSFFIGDTSPEAAEYGAFFNPKSDKNPLIQVESESQTIKIGPKDDLFYHANDDYKGDQKGELNASYPKGVNAFYMMKYELTDGQYALFLNNLIADQRQNRDVTSRENYTGSISANNGVYETELPAIPASYISWGDAMAYADWAGLRPMTELEFTKACRGPNPPSVLDFPWGNDNKLLVQRMPNDQGVLTMRNGWDESLLEDANKEYFGASWYWVLDLAGSKWERLVTVGHPRAGGVGYRGGGFYGYDREYHTYNPFSPVSMRPYGGWHGTMPQFAYGTRFVITAN